MEVSRGRAKRHVRRQLRRGEHGRHHGQAEAQRADESPRPAALSAHSTPFTCGMPASGCPPPTLTSTRGLRQILRRHLERHLAALTRLQADSLEAAQAADRGAVTRPARHVHLHDLVAVARRRVLHRGADLGARRRSLRAQIGVGETGVAQAEAEGVERRAAEVAVRASLHRVVRERRQLIRARVEGHGQTARRVVRARQRVGKRRARLLAAVPRRQHRGGVLGRVVRRDRAAAGQHDDHGLARRDGGLDQGLLRLGQFQGRAVAAGEAGDVQPSHLLAFQVRAQAHADDRDVRVLHECARPRPERRRSAAPN